MFSSLTRLSHITLQVSNAQKVIGDLVTKYQFHPFAARGLDGVSACQVALRNGGVVFMVNENNPNSGRSDMLYDFPLPVPFQNTACNVSFEVEDVPSMCLHLVGEGCELLLPPKELHDDYGCVSYCIVKSVLGNVSHTLIDRKRYIGDFLPGFQYLKSDDSSLPLGNLTHVDHVTYVCPRGKTPHIFDWYRRCLGFQHFPLSKREDPASGFEIVGPRIGLRLTSMACSSLIEGCKLVLAESLPQEGVNQVDQFLQHHTEGGIQHIGLSTPDILRTATGLSQSGVCFARQPSAYYSDPCKQGEIYSVGLVPQDLSQFGILLDLSTVDVLSKDAPKKFLLQIFAEPLWHKSSLYLELIERRLAEGFGEGNIRALWHSMQDLQKDSSLNKHEI